MREREKSSQGNSKIKEKNRETKGKRKQVKKERGKGSKATKGPRGEGRGRRRGGSMRRSPESRARISVAGVSVDGGNLATSAAH